MAGHWDLPNEPNETLGGSVLLGLELAGNEALKGLRVDGGGEESVADLLDVAKHVTLDGSKGNGTEDICSARIRTYCDGQTKQLVM